MENGQNLVFSRRKKKNF